MWIDLPNSFLYFEFYVCSQCNQPTWSQSKRYSNCPDPYVTLSSIVDLQFTAFRSNGASDPTPLVLGKLLHMCRVIPVHQVYIQDICKYNFKIYTVNP
ncbi:hypothetical protein OUZ56_016500 [Daphnia magna]|uniref:Uncharacterized protein n=1 Tax=Daphnia magna TaxID=35525 RepID=A0ABR0AQT9_9CRUS|nr:hypothetical protein OUZ56_016500 [Daphnia magna]